MNCLCCGKPLRTEEKSGWHKSCIKRFFGTTEIPEITIDEKSLFRLAEEGTSKGCTVPGVQKKLSLHLSEERKPRLTIVNYPTGYILKPQVDEYKALPESEQLAMCMADAAGIAVVPHALLRGEDGYAYITKRVDRIFAKKMTVKMLATEDFCQLDLRLTADKYKGSYERCAKIIERYSSRAGLDLTELFMRVVFSFIIGNSDMHLKKFSLLETEQGSAEYVLSPAYDLLPVNIIMPEDGEELALALNGKKTNLRRKDFLIFADRCGIGRISAERMLDKLVSMVSRFVSMCEESLVPDGMKESLAALITARSDRLN